MVRFFAVVFYALAIASCAVQAGERTLVFAAASMKDAVEAVAKAYENDTGHAVSVAIASTGTLARQIEAGAPADVIVAANPQWMNYLQDRRLIDAASRVNLAGNALVIVTGKGTAFETTDLAERLSKQRFAMGDPGHVPAGIYARRALEHLGIWDKVRVNAAFGENVRVALARAARGEVDYAIIYASDARMNNDVSVAYRFNATAHPPIAYTAALTQNAGADATLFLDYMTQAAKRGFFTQYGFLGPMPDG